MCRPDLVLREEEEHGPHCFPLFYLRVGLTDSDQTNISLMSDQFDHFLLDGMIKICGPMIHWIVLQIIVHFVRKMKMVSQ